MKDEGGEIDVVRETVRTNRRARDSFGVRVDVSREAGDCCKRDKMPIEPDAHPTRLPVYRSLDGSRGEESRCSNSSQRRVGFSAVPPRDSMNLRTRSLP